MGQTEIIEVLKEFKRPMTAREISLQLNEGIEKVLKNIKRLIKSKDIIFVEINKEKAQEKFNSKRKMRLYYYL